MDRLTLRDVLVLAALALVARLATALPVDYAPYTDPAYYTLVAERLATGHGFSVPVIWSFLEVGSRLPSPATLPVPSNAHWMPLTSILAAGPMALLGPSYRAGQLPSILLSAALVPATALIAAWLFERRWVAIVSAVLATFAGPLLLYYPTVENFAIFGALGAGSLAAAVHAVRAANGGRWIVLSGLLAGAATLARIDGALLVVAPATAWLARGEFRRGAGWAAGLASAVAFLAVLAPWLIRNLATFGAALPSTGGSTLWITSYNEQFSIGHEVSLSTYLAAGPGVVIGSKLESWFELIGRTAVLLGGTFIVTFIPGSVDGAPPSRAVALPRLLRRSVRRHGWGSSRSTPRAAPGTTPPRPGCRSRSRSSVASLPTVATAIGRWWPFLRRPADASVPGGRGDRRCGGAVRGRVPRNLA